MRFHTCSFTTRHEWKMLSVLFCALLRALFWKKPDYYNWKKVDRRKHGFWVRVRIVINLPKTVLSTLLSIKIFVSVLQNKQKEQKHTLQQLGHIWRLPRAKELPSGTSCPHAGLFFPRSIFNNVLTTTKTSLICLNELSNKHPKRAELNTQPWTCL